MTQAISSIAHSAFLCGNPSWRQGLLRFCHQSTQDIIDFVGSSFSLEEPGELPRMSSISPYNSRTVGVARVLILFREESWTRTHDSVEPIFIICVRPQTLNSEILYPHLPIYQYCSWEKVGEGNDLQWFLSLWMLGWISISDSIKIAYFGACIIFRKLRTTITVKYIGISKSAMLISNHLSVTSGS